jgi:proteasome lid subunit RPN8/RPN11
MLPCRNQAAIDQQRQAFEINPLELLAAEDDALSTKEELVGIVHSHCNNPARPSAADLSAAQIWPEMLWLILSLNESGSIDYSAWWPHQQGLAEVALTRPPTASVLWSANS